MNRMLFAKRAQIIGFLVEGISLRAASQLANCSINTVTKLLVDVGMACAEYQDSALRNLPCKRIQCDAIRSFTGSKQKSVPERKNQLGVGDVWTWTAIDADTKLTTSWMASNRHAEAARAFIDDLTGRLASRVQLTTDGHKVYLEAVERAFGGGIDYAMLVRQYGEGSRSPQGEYGPVEFESTENRRITGNPAMENFSTSYIERQNLTTRMSMHHSTYMVNAFSKKIENHAHAMSLHFMYYNFGRIHRTLGVTPAMQAGVSDHIWSLDEIVALVPEPKAKPRGPYAKRQSHISNRDARREDPNH